MSFQWDRSGGKKGEKGLMPDDLTTPTQVNAFIVHIVDATQITSPSAWSTLCFLNPSRGEAVQMLRCECAHENRMRTTFEINLLIYQPLKAAPKMISERLYHDVNICGFWLYRGKELVDDQYLARRESRGMQSTRSVSHITEMYTQDKFHRDTCTKRKHWMMINCIFISLLSGVI